MVSNEKLVGAGDTIAATSRFTVHEGELHTPTIPGRTRLAWGAVIAGALTALAIMALSGVFAYACGVPVARGGMYGIGAGVWAAISAAIAFFIGGAVVSFLSPRGEMHLGVLHGVLSWVLAVNLTLFGASMGFLRGFMPWSLTLGNGNGYGVTDVSAPAWGSLIALVIALGCAALGGVAGYFLTSPSMDRMLHNALPLR